MKKAVKSAVEEEDRTKLKEAVKSAVAEEDKSKNFMIFGKEEVPSEDVSGVMPGPADPAMQGPAPQGGRQIDKFR